MPPTRVSDQDYELPPLSQQPDIYRKNYFTQTLEKYEPGKSRMVNI